jgi:hypothetical protein
MSCILSFTAVQCTMQGTISCTWQPRLRFGRSAEESSWMQRAFAMAFACVRTAVCVRTHIFKRGSVPSRCTLGSAVFHQFFLRHGGPSSSAFVCPLRLFSSSRFLGKTGGNLLLKIPYRFKNSYGGTPEPQTAQDAPWLHGPSLKKYVRPYLVSIGMVRKSLGL